MRLLALLALLTGLTACSGEDPALANAADAPTGRYLAMARGSVDVEGGLVGVRARQDGVVSEVLARDGDVVAAGQVLARLDGSAAAIALAGAKAEAEQARAQVDVLAARLPEAERRARRVAAAAADGAATGQAADEATGALAVLRAELAAARAAVAVAAQRVAAAEHAAAQNALLAPVAGHIVRRAVRVGDGVSAQGGDLFQLLPDAPRIVRAEVNEQFVARLRPGMAAEIVADAEPERRLSGHLLRIGAVVGPSRLAEDADERAASREVECVLALDGDPALLIGQRVLVRFPSDGASAAAR